MSVFSWGPGNMWNWAVLLIFCGNMLLQSQRTSSFEVSEKQLTCMLHQCSKMGSASPFGQHP